MKVRLARITPYLLAPNGNSWFTHGHRFASGQWADAISVSAEEASSRLATLEPELMAAVGPQVRETLRRRNQSAHMGLFETPTAEAKLAHAAAFVTAVEGFLRIDPATFWREHAGVAEALVAEQLDAVRVAVQARINLARAEFQRLDLARQESLLDAAAAWREAEDRGPDWVEVECPACRTKAEGGGDLDDFGEPDWDRDGEICGWIGNIKTILTVVRCRACGLTLTGAAEIAAAGLESTVDNDRATTEDIFEPDFDDRYD